NSSGTGGLPIQKRNSETVTYLEQYPIQTGKLTRIPLVSLQQQATCNYTQFSQLSSQLSNLVNSQNAYTPISIQDLPAFIAQIGYITSQQSWIGCRDYINNLFNVNDPCFNGVNGSVDPCCYPEYVIYIVSEKFSIESLT